MFIFESKTATTDDAEDKVLDTASVDTPEGEMRVANEVEEHEREAACEAVTYFEGGEEALREFTESADVQGLLEARKMSRKTFVRLGKTDDLTRRKNMACLIIAREKNDPLFKQLADNRKKERKLRNAIYNRYKNQAERIAKISQKKHIKDMQHMKALPKVTI